jgi:ABC-type uncharacterized transport system substrate-binding protein
VGRVRARLAGGALFLLVAAAAALPVRAAGILVLTQADVPQYAQVVASLKAELPAAEVVEAGDASSVSAAQKRSPEVAVAVGTKAFDVAKAQLHGIPLVAAAVLGPDRGGRAEVTAVPLESRPADALAALIALAPSARRVVAIFPPGSAALEEARRAARASGLEVEFRPLPELSGFQELFRSAIAGHDAVWLLPDARLARPEIVRFMVSSCVEQRVVLVGFLEAMTRAGALLSVSADFEAIGKAAARLTVQLADNSKKAQRAELPFFFAPGKVSVNARTREVLGLSADVPESYSVIR